ncbi:MAG: type II toxin-antitoxin system RelE/ParE family toxin [Terracidiphilus sp.]
MPPLRWTPQRLREVARLHDFLERKSEGAARRAVCEIRQAINSLSSFPERGRPIEDMPDEFREWVIEFGIATYVVLYRYDGNETVILAIRHAGEAGY